MDRQNSLGQDLCILRCSAFGKRPAARKMIRMNVGVDHIADFHPVAFGGSEVKLRIIDRVAHGDQAPTSSPEHIGRGYNWIMVEELTENHTSLRFGLSLFGLTGSLSSSPLRQRPCGDHLPH